MNSCTKSQTPLSDRNRTGKLPKTPTALAGNDRNPIGPFFFLSRRLGVQSKPAYMSQTLAPARAKNVQDAEEEATRRVRLRNRAEQLGDKALDLLQLQLESGGKDASGAARTILDFSLGRNNKLVLPPDQYVAVVMDAIAQELPIVVAMARTSQNSVEVDARNGYERIAAAVSASLDKLALSSG